MRSRCPSLRLARCQRALLEQIAGGLRRYAGRLAVVPLLSDELVGIDKLQQPIRVAARIEP